MGCFLACFGSSKTKKRSRKPPPAPSSPALSPKVESSYKPVQPAKLIESIIVVPQSPVRKEEQLSLGIPKKVTFDDSNAKTFNPVSDSVDKSVEISSGTTECSDEKVVDNGVSMEEHRHSLSASESGGSIFSSVRSYPPNHRYHNCRESYNEDEIGHEEEIDVYDYDEERDAYEMEDSPNMTREWTRGSFSSMESRTKSSSGLPMRNLDDMLDDATPVAETKNRELNCVLTPVENSSQLKENSGERQLTGKSKDEQEHTVDASLSSWLDSPQKTPANKTATACGLDATQSETNASSHGSNSVRSFSDRPILGALTMDELKQMTAYSSPRKSPSHNADDRPIIGSVGSHWSEETPSVQSVSASSFKGIPNTTSKYREDKRVNWHSTPFEARLEQALKKGAYGVPL